MSTLMMALIDALGMALLHAVWQLTLLALVLWVLLHLLGSGSAVVRYWLSTAALLLAPVIFVLTVAAQWDPGAASMTVLSVLPGLVESGVVVPAWQIADALPVLVGLWGSGVVVFSLLLLHGLHQARQLRTVAVEPPSAALQRRVDALAARLGIRHPVGVLCSGLADVPMVVGALKPVILLPAIALTGLSSEQLESILLHELAHVRRRDLLVNLLQGLVEIVLFYHPAVWWISQRVRVERELCCDDVVTEHVEPVGYARALLLLEEHRSRTVVLAAAATDGSLKHRIARLVGPAPAPRRSSRGLSAVTLLCLIGLLSAGQSVAQDESDLTVLMSDFLAMQIAIDDADVSRADQDDSLRGDLLAMTNAHTALQEQMTSMRASDPSRWELLVRVRSAQASEHLGLTIKHSDIPSYLSPRQSKLYQMALDDKADVLLVAAQESYQSALQHAAQPAGVAPALDEAVLLGEAETGAQRMALLRGVDVSR